MSTLEYTFSVSPQEYRAMRYFHTFRRHRFQSVFVALAWVGALALAVANLLLGVRMTNVMQMCYIAVGVSMPLLVLSCELEWRRYRDGGYGELRRVVTVSPDWIKLRVVGQPSSEKLDWRMVAAVYELPQGFLIYRDEQMVLLPARVLGPGDTETLEGWFGEQLGRSFKLRGRVRQEATC